MKLAVDYLVFLLLTLLVHRAFRITTTQAAPISYTTFVTTDNHQTMLTVAVSSTASSPTTTTEKSSMVLISLIVASVLIGLCIIGCCCCLFVFFHLYKKKKAALGSADQAKSNKNTSSQKKPRMKTKKPRIETTRSTADNPKKPPPPVLDEKNEEKPSEVEGEQTSISRGLEPILPMPLEAVSDVDVEHDAPLPGEALWCVGGFLGLSRHCRHHGKPAVIKIIHPFIIYGLNYKNTAQQRSNSGKKQWHKMLSDLNHENLVKIAYLSINEDCLGSRELTDNPFQMTYIVSEEIPECVSFARALRTPVDSTGKKLVKGVLIDLRFKLAVMVQVAAAMEYLSENIPVSGAKHPFLGARNVLLDFKASGEATMKLPGSFAKKRTIDGSKLPPLAKLSDYAFSQLAVRSPYYKEPGPNAGRTRLPFRWLPWESLRYGRFDSAADVWNFGVTLWEAINDGRTPYDDMTCDDEALIEHIVTTGQGPPETTAFESCPALRLLYRSCVAASSEERDAILFSAIRSDLTSLYLMENGVDPLPRPDDVADDDGEVTELGQDKTKSSFDQDVTEEGSGSRTPTE